MFRTAFLILSGNAFGSLMLFIRNLLIARLVSIEDYGIAATFAISMAVVEMASGLGLQLLIVQDKSGDDPHLQAGLQGFHLLRSLVSGAALFLLAYPIARFLGISEIAWAYQLLALVPILKGFEHFDIYRLSRRMLYRPLILSKTIPALISVLSIWPLYFSFGDYRVMLYAVLIQWSLSVITSHLVADRPYRLEFNRAITVRTLRFGWPLLINNVLLFAIFQGDKLIVGREMGMTVLAIYAMGATLTLTPSLVAAASEQQFFLPQLSAASNDPLRFNQLSMTAMQTSLVSGLALITVIIMIGGPLVRVLLGAKFEALIPLLTWLAILQAVRTFKVGSTLVALSKAQTGNAMIANAFRVLALPFVWYVAIHGGGLTQIIWIATAAETCAYATSLFLLRHRLSLNLRRMTLPFLTAFALTIAAAAHAIMSGISGKPGFWSAFVVVLLFLMAIVAMRDLRSYVIRRTLTKFSD